MANVIGIPVMMILTAVDKVAINFGKSNEQYLGHVSLSEIKRYKREGHFPEGSMGPKIDAAIRFLEGGGQRVVICHLNDARAALVGETGTHILTDNAFV